MRLIFGIPQLPGETEQTLYPGTLEFQANVLGPLEPSKTLRLVLCLDGREITAAPVSKRQLRHTTVWVIQSAPNLLGRK